MKTPLVSVIMAVHNDAKYLKKGIDCILSQTYSNFEFLIFNDFSSDESEDIILAYDDKRIKYFKSTKNVKLPSALNHLIDIAQGKYLIRMDPDDIAINERIAIQTEILENNPKLFILGSDAVIIDSNDNEIGYWSFPKKDNEIKVNLLFNTTFIHPTVALRREILINNNLRYDSSALLAEDREFWIQCMNYGKFQNINTPLISYRRHNNQVSIKGKQEQETNNIEITLRYWLSISPELNKYDKELIREIIKGHNVILHHQNLKLAIDIYRSLILNSRINYNLDDVILNQTVTERLYILFATIQNKNFQTLLVYLKAKEKFIPMHKKLKLTLKTILYKWIN